MEAPRLDGVNILLEDITSVVAKLEALKRSTRGKGLMAIHRSGDIITGGPLSPASPSLKKSVTTFAQLTSVAAEVSHAFTKREALTRSTRGRLHPLS